MRNALALPVLFGVGGAWGSSFLLIKVIVEDISPLELAAGRIFFGMIGVMAFVLLRRIRLPLHRGILRHVLFLTVLGSILPVTLIALGEQYIESGMAAVLNATTPIFTAVLAAILLTEERFTVGRVAGLVFGFIGVLLLTGSGMLAVTEATTLGQIAVIGASASYGLSNVYARNVLRDIDPLALTALMLLSGVLITTPAVLILHGTSGYASLSIQAALFLAALGLLVTGLAHIAFLWLIEIIGSVRSSLATYIVPAVGLFLGWLVLGEGISGNTLLGTLLIVTGVAAVMRERGPAPHPRLLGGARTTPPPGTLESPSAEP